MQHFLVKHPVHIPDVHAGRAVQKIIFASSNKTYKKKRRLNNVYTPYTHLPQSLTSMVMRITIIHSNLRLCFSLRWLLIKSVSCVQCSSFSFTTYKDQKCLHLIHGKVLCYCCFEMRSVTYVHSAVDAEKLAGLIIELFQMFTVPVEIWGEEQVRPQVYTVSDQKQKF